MKQYQSYHEALSELRAALKYGEIGFGFPEKHQTTAGLIDKRGPFGHMLDEDEFNNLVKGKTNVDSVVMKAFSMEIAEIIELNSYWNMLGEQFTNGALDAQEARLAYDEFLTSLVVNRPDYPNPGE